MAVKGSDGCSEEAFEITYIFPRVIPTLCKVCFTVFDTKLSNL